MHLAIGSAGIAADVEPVGVAADGQMELPPNPNVLGWYRYGPAPGDAAGSAVFGGHLDSNEFGVGQLARLRTTEVGDTITVRTSSSADVAYEVVDVRAIQQERVELDELFRRTGPERIVVVTCGGDYDPRQGYEENLIVTAEPS